MRPAPGHRKLKVPCWWRGGRTEPAGLCAGVLAFLFAGGCGQPAKLEVEISTRIRHHQELILEEGAPPVPLFLGYEAPLSLCLATEPGIDTSQWEVRLELDGTALTSDFLPPSVGLGRVLCFDTPVPQDRGKPRRATLGGVLRDRFDGARRRLPEVRIALDPDDSAYRETRRRILDVARSQELSPDSIAERLLAEARSEERQYPQLSVRARLMAAYFLRRSDQAESLRRVREELISMPGWILEEEAAFWGSQVALARADLALGKDWNLYDAWIHLREAEELQATIADPTHIETVRRQSEILVRVDAAGEGIARLGTAIEDCERWPCARTLLLGAQVTLGWLTLLDPQADTADYLKARRASEAALKEISADEDSRERANLLVNLGHLQLLLGEDPEPKLREAEALLEVARETTGRREVEGWIGIVRGSEALSSKDPARALEVCLELTKEAEEPLVAAWSWGCTARALRLQGNLALASEAFDQALRIHGYATPQRLGQSIALGISRRTEDYYGAARLAADRGDPATTWDLLALLDRLNERTATGKPCSAEIPVETAAHRRERRRLFDELAGLEGSTIELRRSQREALEKSLRQRVQELWRQYAACRDPGDASAAEPRFRAFVVEDELLLLELDPQQGPRLVRRSTVDVPDLRRRLREATSRADGQPPLEDGRWRFLLEPVARALVPPHPESLEAETTFALHGLLQDVPLAALPVEAAHESEFHWFAQLTVPVYQPALPAPETSRFSDGSPLFLVDPRGNLLSPQVEETYHELSPASRVLYGAAATSEAFRQALGHARWLHVDAHGRFDPVYPELSSLQLADRPVTFIELAELPVALRFANLSSCLTGRWPITADSGHYGIAGLLVQKGVPWVIASRSELDNRFAEAFNLAFYSSLGESDDVSLAYGKALEAVRARFPASVWGSLLLLGHPTPRGATSAEGHSPTSEGRTTRFVPPALEAATSAQRSDRGARQ
ncbi:MAG: CHAT domain-containing protein [Acidobacteria bacterium]|nr:CHAT domain-containing protein [Acidobacteriota bacterium]